MGTSKGGRPTTEQAEGKRRELTERQRAYAIWMATPEGIREPKSKKDFADRLGISEVQVWRYGKDPKIAEAIRFLVLQNAGNPEKIGQILDMVFEEAMKKRDLRWAEVWMRATGVYAQFGRTAHDLLEVADEIESDSFSNYSDEELFRLREIQAAAEAEAESIRRAHTTLAAKD